MRTLGVAVLGLFLGLVAGTLLTSAIARPFVDGGEADIPLGIAIALGMLMPVLGIVGAVAAVLIDRKSRKSP
ncbi:hypothetical protein [Catellatospora sp. NPDC049609]|uniref:hypothetical protein n=1 Tax=Catellatospora sp. NPDC049609 TaxID=3155505 RepID=UPI00342F1C63